MPRKVWPKIEQLFEKGFEIRNNANYNAQLIHVNDSTWHTEPAQCGDGHFRHHWHASSIGGCTRAAILRRAFSERDTRTLDSEITLAFGKMLHSFLEEFTQARYQDLALPTYVFGEQMQHIGSETGGCLHPEQDLALKARADWVFAWQDDVVILDLKTESTNIFRIEDAKEKHAKTTAKDEHQLQIAANAIIQEGLGLVPNRVKYGAVTYCSKLAGTSFSGKAYSRSAWKWDTQWFEITDELREEVYKRIDALNDAWAEYDALENLPDKLPLQTMPWGGSGLHPLCRPRSKDDGRGRYCDVRSLCFGLQDLNKVKE